MWGSSFRVELLHARALPRHLLHSLTAVFSSDDHVVLRAASTHLHHLADHLEFLRGIDYSQKHAELVDWNSRDWQDWRNMSSDETDRASYVAWEIDAYASTYGLLNEAFFSLVALGFLTAGTNRQGILTALDGQSWATKHEVLARWGWMQEHRDLLGKGNNLPAPYSCVVAHRQQDGRTTDREFHNLLSFLHCLRAGTGRELLFSTKHQTPDFILETTDGDEVGAEMTEVSISDEWDREQDAQRHFYNAILSRLGKHCVQVHVHEPASWSKILDRISAFDRWLQAETGHTAIFANEVVLTNNELALQLTLTPSSEPLQWIMSNHPGPIGDHSKEMHDTLRRRIQNKINRRKNGGLKKTPTVRPCYLVIYPNHDFGADLEEVVRQFLEHPPIEVHSHFEEIWLSSENRLVRLV